MSMIDSIVLLWRWRNPSLFRWNRFIFEIFLFVDHTVVNWCLSRHLQIVFSALNEIHQFLS